MLNWFFKKSLFMFIIKIVFRVILIILFSVCLYKFQFVYEHFPKSTFILFMGITYLDYKMLNYYNAIVGLLGSVLYSPIIKTIISIDAWVSIEKLTLFFLVIWLLADVIFYFTGKNIKTASYFKNIRQNII